MNRVVGIVTGPRGGDLTTGGDRVTVKVVFETREPHPTIAIEASLLGCTVIRTDRGKRTVLHLEAFARAENEGGVEL